MSRRLFGGRAARFEVVALGLAGLTLGAVGVAGWPLDGDHDAGRPGPPGTSASISSPPAVPPPTDRRRPARVVVSLETIEVEGTLADGVGYTFWTFNGTVPGPFIRVRVGDTVQVRLRNAGSSRRAHSINLHAVTGPGGGAWASQVGPGEEKAFEWVALSPGLYVYHCHTPGIGVHMAHGMYGLILVEPEGGLPPVDREYYVMKGEFYTAGRTMERGHQAFDPARFRDERPEYVVWNGRIGSLVDEGALTARVGETVRLYVGNGGPNLITSLHVVGEIFDRVYPEGGIGGRPLRNVQTTLIPSGGASIVEFAVDLPGRYLLVDHSYSRLDKGIIGALEVAGPARQTLFRALAPAGGAEAVRE